MFFSSRPPADQHRLTFEAPDADDKHRCVAALEHALRLEDAVVEDEARGNDTGAGSSGNNMHGGGDHDAEETAGDGDGESRGSTNSSTASSSETAAPTAADTDADIDTDISTTAAEAHSRHGAPDISRASDGGDFQLAATAVGAEGGAARLLTGEESGKLGPEPAGNAEGVPAIAAGNGDAASTRDAGTTWSLSRTPS